MGPWALPQAVGPYFGNNLILGPYSTLNEDPKVGWKQKSEQKTQPVQHVCCVTREHFFLAILVP